ncbi:MAG: IS4 family transposase [Planctomycetes bacterium]|nr:IS4 family transposase [Planctomycetota bacterium]
MHEGRLIFAQFMDYLPRRTFDNCVERHRGNYNSKGFTCRDQFLAMAYAQLVRLDGLRGIEGTLDANSHCLHHMGFRCDSLSKSTLAHANRNRSWKIYAELAQHLMRKAQRLYAKDKPPVDVDARIFALDSTTIDLCLERFSWALFREAKGAVKMHVLLNLHGNIPDFIVISEGKKHDINILDEMDYLPGAFYLFDRAYVDYKRLFRLHQSGAFFVTRAKRRMRFSVVESRSVDKNTGLRCDQNIRLTGTTSATDYPERLRRIKYRDPETGKTLVFLTNNFLLPAEVVAQLYKQRWQVELFFKWIKQHLRIKNFYGYSENAVRTQLWIAVSVYCLLAIIKKELKADRDLHEIQEILKVSVFQKMPIYQAFSKDRPKPESEHPYKQLSLFRL